VQPVLKIDNKRVEALTARALEFTILTAARTGAVIGATLDEIDIEAKAWTVPPERTGTKISGDDPEPRRVPLAANCSAASSCATFRKFAEGSVLSPSLCSNTVSGRIISPSPSARTLQNGHLDARDPSHNPTQAPTPLSNTPE
jgi:hypothetical protein